MPSAPLSLEKKALFFGGIFALLSPISPLINFSYFPFDVSFSDNAQTPTVDLTLECRLYNAIYMAIIFFFEILKRRKQKRKA